MKPAVLLQYQHLESVCKRKKRSGAFITQYGLHLMQQSKNEDIM